MEAPSDSDLPLLSDGIVDLRSPAVRELSTLFQSRERASPLFHIFPCFCRPCRYYSGDYHIDIPLDVSFTSYLYSDMEMWLRIGPSPGVTVLEIVQKCSDDHHGRPCSVVASFFQEFVMIANFWKDVRLMNGEFECGRGNEGDSLVVKVVWKIFLMVH